MQESRALSELRKEMTGYATFFAQYYDEEVNLYVQDLNLEYSSFLYGYKDDFNSIESFKKLYRCLGKEDKEQQIYDEELDLTLFRIKQVENQESFPLALENIRRSIARLNERNPGSIEPLSLPLAVLKSSCAKLTLLLTDKITDKTTGEKITQFVNDFINQKPDKNLIGLVQNFIEQSIKSIDDDQSEVNTITSIIQNLDAMKNETGVSVWRV